MNSTKRVWLLCVSMIPLLALGCGDEPVAPSEVHQGMLTSDVGQNRVPLTVDAVVVGPAG